MRCFSRSGSLAGLDRQRVDRPQSVPGLDPDNDVEVTVFDGVLRIHAERPEEATGEDGTSRSFSYSYVRSISLPAGDADGILISRA